MEVDKKHQSPNRWLHIALFIIVFLVAFLALGLILPVSGKQDLRSAFYIPIAASTLLSVLLSLLFLQVMSTKDPLPAGLTLKRPGREAVAGGSAGLMLVGAGSMILFFLDSLVFNVGSSSPLDIAITTILLLASSLGEELVFRGIILRRLLEATKPAIALGLSSIAFAFFHINNPEISLVALVNITTGGVLLGITYCYTRNLWFGWMLHFTWNLAQGPLLGFAVSGLRLPSILQTESSGATLITGGDFGLEGSIVQGAVIILFSMLLWQMNRQNIKAE